MMNIMTKGGIKMKRFVGVLGALLMVCAMVGSSQAGTLYQYTDPTYGITYSLDFNGTSGTNTFTISGITNQTDLFTAAFTFKFSGNDTWTLSGLSPTLVDGNTWAVATGSTTVYAGGGNYQTLLQDNRVGFYNEEAGAGGDPLAIASVEINEGLPQSFTFNLAQTAIHGLDAIGDSFAFKALYITNDGDTAQFQGWLSKDLTTQVPEAGALMLFGTGLIGLVGYRRVRRMQ